MPSGAFLYVRNSLHSYLYLPFRDREFVYRYGARAKFRSSVVVNVIVA